MVEVDFKLEWNEKKAFETEITRWVNTALKNEIKLTLSKGIILDEKRIHLILRDALKDLISEQVKTNLKPAIDKALDTFSVELQELRHELIEDTAKLMDCYSCGETLGNVNIHVERTESPIRTNPESFVRSYYEEKGFIVLDFTTFIRYDNSDWLPSKHIEYLFPHSKFERVGAPDLVVWNKNRTNFFLVEVKGQGDGLRREQIEWYLRYDKIPITIFFLDSPSKKRKKSMSPEVEGGLLVEGDDEK